jgi:hypothetical protein
MQDQLVAKIVEEVANSNGPLQWKRRWWVRAKKRRPHQKAAAT